MPSVIRQVLSSVGLMAKRRSRALSASKSMMPGAYSVAKVLPGADSAVI
mgnify:CR=1 FL=1